MTMEPYIIGQISDMHVRAGGQLSNGVVDTAAALACCIEHVLALPRRPDVLLFTGDLVDTAARAEYAELKRLLAPLPMPWYLIPGNHDDRDSLRECFPDHGYLRQWAPYAQYAVDEGPLRLIGLDTLIPGEGAGRLCAERLDWLDCTLSAGRTRPSVVFMHHPPFVSGIARMDEIRLEAPERLAEVVSKHGQVERVLCGHVHRSIQARFAGTVASTCPSPAHQIFLDVAPDAPVRFTLEPPGYQLHFWGRDTGVVSHTVSVGDFPGPFPFTD
jgi:3',5'-cyclic AMP phosphodiesterase CpdA